MDHSGEAVTLTQVQEKRPSSWEKRVMVAYLRALGVTWAACASAVGVSLRTVHRWQEHESWSDAVKEAADRWHVDMDQKSRAVITQAVEKFADDPTEAGKTARWYLERTDPRLAPPAIQHQLSGSEGGAVPIIVGAAPAGLLRATE